VFFSFFLFVFFPILFAAPFPSLAFSHMPLINLRVAMSTENIYLKYKNVPLLVIHYSD